ncbi:MAG: WD40/YVTN/BNR-like repeat-containing protein, partial [Stellaceae bacterium]
MAQTQVYAGAGKWRGGARCGVFRFAPGDTRAEQLTQGLPERVSVQAITVHPLDPAVVFIGTDDGVYVSHDRGARWMKPEFDKGVQVWSILVHPAAPRTILAGASPVAVYRSDDGGERWQRIAAPRIEERVRMGFPCRVMRLAIDAARPDNVFATVEVNGVMRSSDGGASWSDCSAGLIRF